MDDDSGRRFFDATRHSRSRLVGGEMDWSAQPDWFKVYPGAPRVELPEAEELPEAGVDVFDAMTARRSLRAYADPPLTLEELARLLWAGAGVTAEQAGFAFRTAPSAGGLYPIETYVVAHRVDGLGAGVYHYAVLEHALEQLDSGDRRAAAARAALGQPIAATAAAVFVWTAVLERSRWKYGERAFRYIFLDAAHIAQNVALAAVALGLGSCQVAAFFDDEAAALLGVDPRGEPVVYMTTVGAPAG
jgi:SagB-type dehydrogenase family enzyme